MIGRAQVRGLLAVALAIFIVGGLTIDRAAGDLLLYEPFNYTVGDTLGGTDPDGAGPTAGTPVGKTNTNIGGGTWYARGTGSNYQSPRDTQISTGNLSYAGLAPSVGNSVSYGSEIGTLDAYADSIDLPGSPITSGSLYASFIIRLKSNVADPDVGTTVFRHSPAGFSTSVSDAMTAGSNIASQGGGTVATPGLFYVRRDAFVGGITNFSPSKSNSDGIGPGAAGNRAGWQSTDPDFTEGNQFGNVNPTAAGPGAQPPPDFGNPATYQTYFVVLKYAFDVINSDGQNDAVSLWMNPGVGTLGSAAGEADASQAPTGNLGSYFAAVNAYGTGPLDVADIKSFALIGHRQNQNQSIAVDFDELRIGTTWQSVTPTMVAVEDDADFDGDGDVDGADFLTWQRNLGPGNQMQGDADGNGTINGADLDIWKMQYGPAVVVAGSVPEPAAYLMALAGLLAVAARRQRTS